MKRVRQIILSLCVLLLAGSVPLWLAHQSDPPKQRWVEGVIVEHRVEPRVLNLRLVAGCDVNADTMHVTEQPGVIEPATAKITVVEDPSGVQWFCLGHMGRAGEPVLMPAWPLECL